MWKDIWQNKGKNLKNDDFSMIDLLKMNGYDTSGDALSVQGWVDYTHYIANILQVCSGDKSLLEVGCGGGCVPKSFI